MRKLVNLRELRERAALSQGELASGAGISKNAVGQLERGEFNPRPATVRRLAEALGVRPEELWESTVPKAQAPPSHEELAEQEVEEELQMERRADEFMTQRPSDEERIKFIEDAVNILRTYHDLGQRERSKMGEDLTLHGTGYVWHGFYFNALQPAMERDGVLLHASFVVDGPAEVSERERAACEKLRNYDVEMQNLVWDMRILDNENNDRVREEVSQGVAQASEWLEDLSKGAPDRRVPGEKGEAGSRSIYMRGSADTEDSSEAGEGLRSSGDVWQKEYLARADETLRKWEAELEEKVALLEHDPTQSDPAQFTAWSEEVEKIGRPLIDGLVSGYMATARTKLEVVVAVAAFMQPWEELLKRIEDRIKAIATLSEEDEQKLYEVLEQARNATKTDERVR